MTATTGVGGYLRKRARGPLQAMGGFFKMCLLTGKALGRPFEGKEFVQYSWFLMSVALLPTFAMSIPLTVLIIFIFNLLLQEFGAASVGDERMLERKFAVFHAGDDGFKLRQRAFK